MDLPSSVMVPRLRSTLSPCKVTDSSSFPAITARQIDLTSSGNEKLVYRPPSMGISKNEPVPATIVIPFSFAFGGTMILMLAALGLAGKSFKIAARWSPSGISSIVTHLSGSLAIKSRRSTVRDSKTWSCAMGVSLMGSASAMAVRVHLFPTFRPKLFAKSLLPLRSIPCRFAE